MENGFHLIDIEGGFFIARFYSRDDYLHVLEDGPWIVMGYYLTVSKWKPNIRPSMEEILTIMVWIRLLELLVVFLMKICS